MRKGHGLFSFIYIQHAEQQSAILIADRALCLFLLFVLVLVIFQCWWDEITFGIKHID
jgi:hypothetical protein